AARRGALRRHARARRDTPREGRRRAASAGGARRAAGGAPRAAPAPPARGGAGPRDPRPCGARRPPAPGGGRGPARRGRWRRRDGTSDAVEQLGRYLERADLAPCRGVLAAQTIKPQARTLAESRGIRCVEVDLAALRGEREPELTLFAE